MAEQLLLRKGLYANLKDTAIIPGAISITTDEPGIYIDVADYDEHGNIIASTKDRLRIGDFISFKSLQDLYNATDKNYPIGDTPVYSEHALYYAEAENVLCKYVPASGGVGAHFVWINDTSELTNRISTLEDQIGGIADNETSINNLKNAIGGAYTSTNTIFY